MKLSKYNYIVKNADSYIMFNSVSGSVICVDDDFLNNLNQGFLQEQEKQLLYKMGFLVDKNCDELQRLLDNNKTNIQSQDNKIFTICPTTHCNARCFYCFENDRKHCVMTKQIAEDTIKFIVKDTLNSNAKHLTINWFGGEPLLAQNTIDFITQSLLNNKEFMQKVDMSANITTNGILINPEIIQKFNDWKIKAVQITLDGYGKVYEQRKNYFNTPNAFKKIIEVIKELCNNKINTSIRLNYDDENINSILELIEYLNKELTDEQKQNLQTYPAKLECNQSCSICNLRADDNYLKILKQLHISNIGKSFKQLNLKYRFAHCLIGSEYNYVIGADGNIYKCNEHVDNISKSIGNVQTGIKGKIVGIEEIDETCKECKMFPICQGGCPQRKGDSFAKCQIEKFILEDILKLYIQ